MDIVTLSDAHPDGYRELPPEGAQAHLDRFRLVDVREPWEFAGGPLGHIEGAELVPLGTLVDAAAGWDRSRPILVVCRSGARSGRAASALARLGFAHVYNLVGGMLVWNANGLPVVGREA